jgi:hypothetical protein
MGRGHATSPLLSCCETTKETAAPLDSPCRRARQWTVCLASQNNKLLRTKTGLQIWETISEGLDHQRRMHAVQSQQEVQIRPVRADQSCGPFRVIDRGFRMRACESRPAGTLSSLFLSLTASQSTEGHRLGPFAPSWPARKISNVDLSHRVRRVHTNQSCLGYSPRSPIVRTSTLPRNTGRENPRSSSNVRIKSDDCVTKGDHPHPGFDFVTKRRVV